MGRAPHRLRGAAAVPLSAAPPPFPQERLTSVKYLPNPCSEDSPQSGFVEAVGGPGVASAPPHIALIRP